MARRRPPRLAPVPDAGAIPAELLDDDHPIWRDDAAVRARFADVLPLPLGSLSALDRACARSGAPLTRVQVLAAWAVVHGYTVPATGRPDWARLHPNEEAF